MPGINTTGTPNTSDYILGRGKVYFAPLLLGKPQAYRDLGNAPEFSFATDSETLEHLSSRGGLKVVDKEVIISQKITLSLSLDEINFDNLALFVSGQTTTKATGFDTWEAQTTDGSALTEFNLSVTEQGRWYDLYANPETAPAASDFHAERIYDIRADSVFTIKDTLATPADTTAVEGVDFTVDRKMGMIFIIDGTAKIPANDDYAVHITAGTGTVSTHVDVVQALTSTNIAGALKFIPENPADSDRKYEFQFHQVSLKAEGEFSLISDDWTTMQFTGVAEANETADSTSKTLTISVPNTFA
jgi:hypothetical protein